MRADRDRIFSLVERTFSHTLQRRANGGDVVSGQSSASQFGSVVKDYCAQCGGATNFRVLVEEKKIPKFSILLAPSATETSWWWEFRRWTDRCRIAIAAFEWPTARKTARNRGFPWARRILLDASGIIFAAGFPPAAVAVERARARLKKIRTRCWKTTESRGRSREKRPPTGHEREEQNPNASWINNLTDSAEPKIDDRKRKVGR